MSKKIVMCGLIIGLAVLVGPLCAKAQTASPTTQSVLQPAPPPPSFPNMAVIRAQPQDYAEHMKALQQRKDTANAVLPTPRPVAGAAKTPPNGGTANGTTR